MEVFVAEFVVLLGSPDEGKASAASWQAQIAAHLLRFKLRPQENKSRGSGQMMCYHRPT
jgi:hypothetical protein